MSQKPVRWVDALRRIFNPARKKRRTTRLAVERLDDRINPTIIFNPNSLAVDGAVDSLRTIVTDANAANDSDVVINLTGGATYTLTIGNSAGQENLNAEGDLDVANTGFAGTKSYSFVGLGTGATIQQTSIDRIFQLLGPGVTVSFANVTLTGGTAIDDGSAGAVAGDTDAKGGGILNESGGDVSFTSASLVSNAAVASDGAAGSDGSDAILFLSSTAGNGGTGASGKNAFGGGIYSTGGTITIQSSSAIIGNSATAGRGGDGGAGGDVALLGSGNAGSGGDGGAGGNAGGGGVYAEVGDLIVDTISLVQSNLATAGLGGSGGNGGNALVGSGAGGAGGAGGSGGDATGGALYTGSGSVTVLGTSAITDNGAFGAGGGNGGNGGTGIIGAGVGGAAGDAGDAIGGAIADLDGGVTIGGSSQVRTNVASAGSGGAGGSGGTPSAAGGVGGSGGVASGGGIFAASGDVVIDNTSVVASNSARAGGGGSGGFGATGGAGGNAGGGGVFVGLGSVTVDNASIVDANGANAGGGGAGGGGTIVGGVGGTGGSAWGGGILVVTGGVTLDHGSSASANLVQADNGGAGGVGASAGDSGDSFGGGVAALSGNVLVDNSSVVNNNTATGSTGASGGTGGLGASGSDATGGGIFAATGNVTIDHASSVNGNFAIGQRGGNGASGGSGRGGGIAVDTGSVTIDNNSSVNSNNVTGGLGVSGSTGSTPTPSLNGSGTNGGDGGDAMGGGIFIATGSVLVGGGAHVDLNTLVAGDAGVGGGGGDAVSSSFTGGNGGAGGAGGVARGGGIWAADGSVTVSGAAFVSGNDIRGGVGAAGGLGGAGGPNGIGGIGGAGGAGGDANGGGIWAASGSVAVSGDATVPGDSARGGAGGLGGLGGNVFAGSTGSGGTGGAGGAGGSASGGGIWAGGGNVTVNGGSDIDNNSVTGGAGGAGRLGGSGVVFDAEGGAGGAGGGGTGGGIAAGSGTVTVTGASVDGNSAGGGAGGVGGKGGGTVGIGGAGGAGGDALGGGIAIDSGSLALSEASIDGNKLLGTAAGGAAGARGGTTVTTGTGGTGGAGGDKLGGGVYASAGAVSVSISSSSITQNEAAAGGAGGAGGSGGAGLDGAGGVGGDKLGGGAYLAAAVNTISNSTIAFNVVRAGGASTTTTGSSRGGGAFIAAGSPATISNSTVADNTSSNEGGGIRNEGTLTLVSTLIAGNTSTLTTEEDLSNPGGGTANFTLIQSPNGHTFITGVNNNIVGASAAQINLANALTVAANGTRYVGFLGTSVAFNAGSNPDNLVNDQRGAGFPREADGVADIGAIEGVGGSVTTVPLVVVSTKGGVVKLVNPATGEIIQAFRPFGSYQGVVNVALGDINNDGFLDIITATRSPRGGRVKVYDGKAALTDNVDFNDPVTWPTFLTPATGLVTPLIANIKAFGAGYTGGLSVASGDVNNDGLDDIVVGKTVGSAARVAVYSGAGAHPKLGTNIKPFGNFTGGVNVAAGNLDADPAAEILISTASQRGRVKIFDFNGTAYSQVGATLTPFASKPSAGVQITALDIDNDGVSEFAAAIKKSHSVNINVYDNTSTLLASFPPPTLGAGVQKFGIGKTDLDQDGNQELVLGVKPAGANQFLIIDPLTGSVTGGFNAFTNLTGGISVDGA